MQYYRDKLISFLRRPFFTDSRTLLGLWMILAIAGALHPEFNNFKIFRGVFWHTVNQTSLFAEYPAEYFDTNHYGPFFSLVIAPFALMPIWLGRILWSALMTLFLFKAVYSLPVTSKKMAFICWFSFHSLLTALQMSQFNVVIAAIIALSFVFVEKEKDFWAGLLIAVGTFVKLYGVVGLAFFFFSKHKGKFILSLILWSSVCYLLPMLISSPEYINAQYVEWFQSIVDKNAVNQNALGQNISLLGMVHRVSECWFSDLFLILPGMALFALPYLRFKQYRNPGFRLAYLASVLMFTVLFSTGSETSTYIIAFIGVGIWYWSAPWKRGKWEIALMVFAFILSGMPTSDLFPRWLWKHLVSPYSLAALPCVIIWLKLACEMITRDYSPMCNTRID